MFTANYDHAAVHDCNVCNLYINSCRLYRACLFLCVALSDWRRTRCRLTEAIEWEHFVFGSITKSVIRYVRGNSLDN